VKAIAVYPGQSHSMHLEEVPKPSVTDVPDERGVLVEVLRVGVDGTDREIDAAEYGQAPPGEDFLITGRRARRRRARACAQRLGEGREEPAR
jgi:threonine dehydrogenase-like Zn-dependent dehydrogenase